MNTETAIRNKIMRRVYGVWLTRTLMQPKARVIGFGAVALVIAASVSIKDVIQNALSAAATPGGFLHYSIVALSSTEALVKVLSLIALAILFFIVRDVCVFCISAGFSLIEKPAQHHS